MNNTLLRWLAHHHLSVPAWTLAESMRPLAWLAGQVALVGSPVAGLFDIAAWDEWAETLNDPERYDALCRALAAQSELEMENRR